MMDPSPAGLEYLPDVDTLVMKFSPGETTQTDTQGQLIEVENGLVLMRMHDPVDGRLYMLSFTPASRFLPPAVLRNAPGQPLEPRELSDTPGAWLLPLFPDAHTTSTEPESASTSRTARRRSTCSWPSPAGSSHS